MTDTTALELDLPDEAATARLGALLGAIVLEHAAAVRSQGFTLGLRGELGTGKTALARALLREAGVRGTIKSPTFTLVEPYELSRLDFYHFDFYRFEAPAEFAARGFEEYFQAGAACLVEWPERADGYLPLCDLDIALVIRDASRSGAEPGRSAMILAHTELGQRCRQEVASRWQAHTA